MSADAPGLSTTQRVAFNWISKTGQDFTIDYPKTTAVASLAFAYLGMSNVSLQFLLIAGLGFAAMGSQKQRFLKALNFYSIYDDFAPSEFTFGRATKAGYRIKIDDKSAKPITVKEVFKGTTEALKDRIVRHPKWAIIVSITTATLAVFVRSFGLFGISVITGYGIFKGREAILETARSKKHAKPIIPKPFREVAYAIYVLLLTR